MSSEYDRLTDEMIEDLNNQVSAVALATSQKEKTRIINTYKKNMDPSGFSISIQCLWGLTVCFISALMCAAGYVGLFGYGIGGFLYYAFVTECYMPIQFHTLYQCGMIPFLNFFLAVIAFWMLLLKYAWFALLWILDFLGGWLPIWLNNIPK